MDNIEKLVEMPQIEIPDEIRQTEIPEIEETTPHPKPESPLADYGTNGAAEPSDGNGDEKIGFFS